MPEMPQIGTVSVPHGVQLTQQPHAPESPTARSLTRATACCDEHHLLCVSVSPCQLTVYCVQVNSFAAQFESAGNSSSFAAVNSFYNSITMRHSFATGGSNDHEYWGPPLTMADAIMEVRPPHYASSAI